ncbi:ATP-binding protein [Actinocorallia lasiicapitis]
MEREFPVTVRAATEARRWALGWLPPGCESRDDLATVVTELMANLAEHSSAQTATLRLTHDVTGIRGVLIDHAPAAPVEIDIPWTTIEEIESLHSPHADPACDDFVANLSIGGRGLLVVTALCQSKVEITQHPDRTITRWHLSSCICYSRI